MVSKEEMWRKARKTWWPSSSALLNPLKESLVPSLKFQLVFLMDNVCSVLK
ncbi:hypothetical protein K0M31_002841 [Melipona bicolor]|uniref:Uncharacterized protein n=1 Tax=Melipona bicolor TaxID=60889 RepID=A0AA40FZU9_9HYME|nr:hypothetical protein K0M31_002841 [Melipona bicolor]